MQSKPLFSADTKKPVELPKELPKVVQEFMILPPEIQKNALRYAKRWLKGVGK